MRRWRRACKLLKLRQKYFLKKVSRKASFATLVSRGGLCRAEGWTAGAEAILALPTVRSAVSLYSLYTTCEFLLALRYRCAPAYGVRSCFGQSRRRHDWKSCPDTCGASGHIAEGENIFPKTCRQSRNGVHI
jgi:hypothetical protein